MGDTGGVGLLVPFGLRHKLLKPLHPPGAGGGQVGGLTYCVMILWGEQRWLLLEAGQDEGTEHKGKVDVESGESERIQDLTLGESGEEPRKRLGKASPPLSILGSQALLEQPEDAPQSRESAWCGGSDMVSTCHEPGIAAGSLSVPSPREGEGGHHLCGPSHPPSKSKARLKQAGRN